MVDVLVLVLPSLMAFDYRIGRKTIGRLEAITSTVHLNMKFYFDKGDNPRYRRRIAQSCHSKVGLVKHIASNTEVNVADLDARYDTT